MTDIAHCATGASSDTLVNWDSIDWVSVNANVRRLQARIVKATEQQRWGKVKALQRLLTRTPGVDGVRWTTARQKASAVS